MSDHALRAGTEARTARGAAPARRGLDSRRVLAIAAAIVSAFLLLPLGALAVTAIAGEAESWRHLASTVLGRYIANTLVLVVLVGIGVTAIGTTTAWLVTTCRFPGRRVFEWAMILPLALPAYVTAYAYTQLLQHPGPIQTWLRGLTGWGPREYWFPEIRSLEGAALVFALVLYPYVYLLARAAFLQQSATAFEASRTLGASPWRSFFRVALPMARPAIVAGTALALMETLADFGAVAHFGVDTFTTAIYKTWFSIGDRVAAVQLSLVLVAFVFLLLAFERIERGKRRVEEVRPGRGLERFELSGWRAAGAFAACATPLALGFVVPVTMLLVLGIRFGDSPLSPRYLELMANSLTLAGIAAAIALVVAVVLAYGSRIAPSAPMRAATRLAGFGYALPGSVIAVGLLVPLTAFDNTLDGFMRSTFGIATGLILTGTIAALIYAYVVRYLAVALGTVDAAFGKIPPSLDGASRTLGKGAGATLLRIHLPLMKGGLLTAFLIVFVDVMKELPATLIMRPFDFDTLAVQAYRLASDERLAEASVPSLMIVAAGLVPVILLSWQIARTRIGERARPAPDPFDAPMTTVEPLATPAESVPRGASPEGRLAA